MAKKKITSMGLRTELARLGTQVRRNIWKMLDIVNTLLSDTAYVDANGGENALTEEIEKADFGHFGGKLGLKSMMHAYHANPSEAVWRQHDFNVMYMIDLANPESDKADAAPRNDWVRKCADLELALAQEKTITANQAKQLGEQSETITSLRGIGATKDREIGELTGRLEESRRVPT